VRTPRALGKGVTVETRGKKDDTVSEEISAFGQRAKGAAKDVVGDVIDDEEMEAEGERENAIGRARQATNDIMDETDGVRGATINPRPHATGSTREEASAAGQRAKGAVKDIVGDATGNTRMEREGEIENAVGRARQRSNNAVGAARADEPVARSGYVTGLYTTPEAASRAYDVLTTKHGYKPSDINVVMSDETRRRHFFDGVRPARELKHGTKAAEGLGKGAAVGGGVGAALAALFAVGTSVAIPGLGLVVAGPIAAALAGAGAGGATGGIIGALIGAGIPEDRVREYERGLADGGIVIGTRYRDPDHARELERDYAAHGGTHVRY
jgi:uncharacterized protein YjbJ (UPF0337 family)